MPQLEPIEWFVVALSAVVVGVSKTGIPGVGILPAILMALVLPAQESVGTLLGILILADLFAAAYHRRNAQWSHMIRLLPPAFAGIVAGFFALKVIDDRQLRPIIGAIVLAMLALNHWRTRSRDADIHVPTQWWFAVGLGLMAGLTSMMANAAGPIVVIYLLAMRLPKVASSGPARGSFSSSTGSKSPSA